MRQVFLDYQASTPLAAEVFEAMRPYFVERFGSPASLHQHGMRARDALEKSREQVANLVNAEFPEEIIFTSGGTEAVNLALKGVAYANQARGNHIIVTAIEHPAVLNSAEFLEKNGFEVTRVGVDSQGYVDPNEIKSALRDRTILVCLQHANHDIGTIEPVEAVSRIVAERGIPLFVDAVASAGWLPIDVQELGIQMLSFSPHRFYGPKGVGVLYRNRRTRVSSLIHGGVQEGGRRAGTENVPGIVGAGVAAEIARSELAQRITHTRFLQNRLWDVIRRTTDYVQLNGPAPGPKRLSTNLNISVEFVEGEAVLLRLDMQGVAVASGTSCASKALKISHVLAAIGLDHALAQGNIIMSLGRETTESDIDYVSDVFSGTVKKLRDISPVWEDFQRGLVDSVIHAGGAKSPTI